MSEEQSNLNYRKTSDYHPINLSARSVVLLHNTGSTGSSSDSAEGSHEDEQELQLLCEFDRHDLNIGLLSNTR